MFSALFLGKHVTQQIGLATLRCGYKSSISLDKLYPKSSLDFLSKPDVQASTGEQFNGFIPIEKLKMTNVTCSKPGGQHVNKTKTGVEIRFHVKTADWIPETIREKLFEKNINRINKDGFLIVKSEKTRKNLLNQADCMDQIRSMIFDAAQVKKEISADDLIQIEINKKIADGRRLVEKRRKSEKRSIRRSPIYDSTTDYYN